MARFKVSFHCAQVNTFVIDEYESKEDAFAYWESKIDDFRNGSSLMRIGDVLIAPNQITFVVIEEVVEAGAEPASGTTVDV